ncbi:hypothetical protein BDZ90DRAFT_80359 [Jaminaea rosea]|uniref:Pre-mRNA-processing factor 19 n=1 Tax=Jaminaea rosea TaxID=1569628 RepID=A0A316UPU2_9BASI|nr:hypothetical protein BDZ90DRAFT_80359 [Jaminaea rosea]PWN25155.1 hypothetical protein BDZ90DRAFT_80359 [Jaminaea rosea]
MFCAISGGPPQVPVISVKSGLVYESRLIRKYIDENGKEPTTGEPLKEDELVEVKASKYHDDEFGARDENFKTKIHYQLEAVDEPREGRGFDQDLLMPARWGEASNSHNV